MRSYDEIFAIAAERKGGAKALEAMLVEAKPEVAPTNLPEDRWLSAMTRGVFQAGFSWKVIESKWPGFETAFKSFDVDACAMMDDTWLDQLLKDEGIVRNGAKIQSVRDNAVFIQGLRAEGGISDLFGNWPATDFVGLLARMKDDGARLGGTTGQYLLRTLGCDSFVLSKDVVGRLIAEGVVDKAPTSKKAMAAVQQAFNTWSEQSGHSLTRISRTLALSL
ncbi:MAG: DNA-3-methyladenine glycosylase I [Pseudomonadota bacterium]